MSDIVSIDRGASLRQERERRRDIARSDHPALRWVAGDVFYIAHRRGDDDTAVCGAPGSLILAPPAVPRCVECYPLAART